MTIKSLILGSAAAVLAVTGAQAADLPAAEPVEYVKVCDTFGTGFFYIPGTETCLKVGGYVRYDLNYLEPVGSGTRSENHTWTRAEAATTFDARTMTEYGLLRSFIDVRYRGTSAAPFTAVDAAGGVRFERAFIQFGGLTAGRAESFFDFWPGYAWGPVVDTIYSYLPTNLLAYTFAFGNGFSATLSVEDGTFRNIGTGIENVGRGGHTVPDVVAALRVDQGWGSAQVAGALHQNRFTTLTTADAEFGYAVMGGVSINLPMIAEGDQFSVHAAYSEGATEYVGTFESLFVNSPMWLGTEVDGTVVGNNYKATKGWSVAAGFVHNWTPQFSTALTGSYLDINHANTSVVADWDAYNVILTNNYMPVDGLTIGAEVAYENVDIHGVGGVPGGDVDYFSGLLRIQRDF